MARGIIGANSLMVAATVINQLLTTGELSSGISVDVSEEGVDRSTEMGKAENLAIYQQYTKGINNLMRPP